MIEEPPIHSPEFGFEREPDYEVVTFIGRGSYGDVYLARERNGEWCAVKVVYRVSFDDDRTYEREYKGILEFEPVSKQSESQLQIIHVGRHDDAGRYYYIMEVADDVVSGRNIHPSTYQPRTIKSEMRRRGALPVKECIEIGLHLAEALEKLHENGKVHRDIKPANIIFVKGRAKLADVGLVTRAELTMSCAGTEGYIPLEGPGVSGDIFALGKVLYEMWTGFDRLSFPDLPPQLDQRPDHDLVIELNYIITNACQINANDRYESARLLRKDLQRVMDGKPLHRGLTTRGLIWLSFIGVIVAFMAFKLTLQWRFQGDLPQLRDWTELGRSRTGEQVSSDDLAGTNGARLSPNRNYGREAVAALEAGFQAYEKDDYEKAAASAETATQSAALSLDTDLRWQSGFLRSEVANCAEAYHRMTREERAATKSTEEGRTCLAKGRFLCFSKNDWDQGLPLLVRGDDSVLADLARLELSATPEPWRLAESWYQASVDPVRSGDLGEFATRARHWYMRGLASSQTLLNPAIRTEMKAKLERCATFPARLQFQMRLRGMVKISVSDDRITLTGDRDIQELRVNQIRLSPLPQGTSHEILNHGASRFMPDAVDLKTARVEKRTAPRSGLIRVIENSERQYGLQITHRSQKPSDFEFVVLIGE